MNALAGGEVPGAAHGSPCGTTWGFSVGVEAQRLAAAGYAAAETGAEVDLTAF
jgi:hypothetical protein